MKGELWKFAKKCQKARKNDRRKITRGNAFIFCRRKENSRKIGSEIKGIEYIEGNTMIELGPKYFHCDERSLRWRHVEKSPYIILKIITGKIFCS